MIDFTKVDTGSIKSALPEGWYTVQAAKADLRESKNGPKTMINTEFNILSPVKYDKRKVWTNFNLGTNSLWALKTFLEKANSDLLNKGDVNEETIAAGMPGLVCQAYLEPDTSPSGDPRNRITNWKESETVDAESRPSAEAQPAETQPKSPLFK
jgi:hypothetical protein